MSNCGYCIIAPFMPLEFEKKGISPQATGFIFAFYSVAIMVGSPFMGYVISKFGRRKTILSGIALMGFSFIAFGLLAFIDVSTTKTYYIVAALVSRFCQGIGSVCIQVTCYSIAANFYPEKKTKVIGILDGF